MKTNIFKSLFILAIVLLTSCESDLRMPDVVNVAYPKLTLDPTSDVLIQGGKLSGKFIVDMHYVDKPSDSRVVISMNGEYGNVKVLKESLKVFPETLTITDDQLVTMFGLTSIVPGDYFEVGLDVMMVDGKWYPAFNSAGVAYGSGPTNLPDATPSVKFKAVCALDVDEFVGTATIDDPYWYEGVYTAQIEKVDATHLKFKNFAEFAGDLIITIDPVTHLVSVDKQSFDTNLAAWGMADYTNPSAIGKGELDACKRIITLTLAYSVDQGGFGSGPVKISY